MIRGQVKLERSVASQASDDPRVVELIMLAQEQLNSQMRVIRLDDLADQSVYPAVPDELYTLLFTGFDVYLSIYYNSTYYWRSLGGQGLYEAGDTIETDVMQIEFGKFPVGTRLLLYNNSGSNLNFGDTVAGVLNIRLVRFDAAGLVVSATGPSGTWTSLDKIANLQAGYMIRTA